MLNRTEDDDVHAAVAVESAALSDAQIARRSFFPLPPIARSLAWLHGVEIVVPDRWDLLGSTITVFGARVILRGPRE